MNAVYRYQDSYSREIFVTQREALESEKETLPAIYDKWLQVLEQEGFKNFSEFLAFLRNLEYDFKQSLPPDAPKEQDA